MQPKHSETQSPHTFYGSDGPVSSMVSVFGSFLLIPLLIMLIASIKFGRNWWRARFWKTALRNGQTPTQGDCAVQGTVQLGKDSARAVRVEITQRGSERLSKKVKHSWKEMERKVIANPFYITTPGGTRIRVEPSDDLRLIAKMNQTERIAADRRIRAAELGAGGQLFAFGSLQPHHGADAAWLLRAPRNRRMTLSTEPIHAHCQRNARFQLFWVILACLIVLIAQLIAVPYHARLWFGETVVGQVVEKQEIRRNKGIQYVVATRVGDRVDEHSLSRNQYETVAEGDSVWLRHVPWWPSNQQVGPKATAPSVVASWFTFPVLFLLIPLYFLITRQERDWWENKLNDYGSGPLPAPKPTVPR